MTQTSGHFHVLAKPTGAMCNLDCKYCFFLSKEVLYPDSDFRMADDLLESYIRQLLESQPGAEVTIAWQGGEPTLMGLDFFRRAMELAEKYRRPGQRWNTPSRPTARSSTTSGASFFSRAPLSGRPQRGWPPRAARHLPRRQGGGDPSRTR